MSAPKTREGIRLANERRRDTWTPRPIPELRRELERLACRVAHAALPSEEREDLEEIAWLLRVTAGLLKVRRTLNDESVRELKFIRHALRDLGRRGERHMSAFPSLMTMVVTVDEAGVGQLAKAIDARWAYTREERLRWQEDERTHSRLLDGAHRIYEEEAAHAGRTGKRPLTGNVPEKLPRPTKPPPGWLKAILDAADRGELPEEPNEPEGPPCAA